MAKHQDNWSAAVFQPVLSQRPQSPYPWHFSHIQSHADHCNNKHSKCHLLRPFTIICVTSIETQCRDKHKYIHHKLEKPVGHVPI